MALWNKLQTELDRFGRVAQSAFDEGKARLEIVRVRQLADRAAQALGYAVHNARKSGGELEAETYARLSSTLAAHEAEAERLEAQLEAARTARHESGPASPGTSSTGRAGTTGGAHDGFGRGGATGTTPSSVDPAMGDEGAGGAAARGHDGMGGSGGSTSGSTSGGPVHPPYSGPYGGGGSYGS
jgi:hypothetical protein